jgi:N-acetyl-gamma-glutamyl-phosphate/LysW-gamma-L-alpha-aminoadipyl-6-phosphate reductase
MSSTTVLTTVPVWIFGAKGMLAGELLRLLDLHPTLQLRGAVSRSEQALVDAHPHARSTAKTCSSEEARSAIGAALRAGETVAAFLALPHGESVATWKALKEELGDLAGSLYLVDLAADFRLRSPERYAAAYGHPHGAPEELAGFAYGLPELHREAIAKSHRVASAGCFATAMQLACVPAARAKLLDASRPWILHGITGSSGSGAEPKPGTHHPWRHGNLWAYSLDGHRHEAELAQALEACDARPPIHFIAHSGPFARGIHMTCALPLARKTTSAEARAIYAEAFADESYVEVLDGKVPDLRSVSGSNRASIAVHVRGEVLDVLVTLDNMVKGGAGQALQCMNLMLGFPETWGLPRAGLGVV